MGTGAHPRAGSRAKNGGRANFCAGRNGTCFARHSAKPLLPRQSASAILLSPSTAAVFAVRWLAGQADAILCHVFSMNGMMAGGFGTDIAGWCDAA